MKITLYHYVHCPYCIRARLALGFLKLSYKSVVLPYDDEITPVKLTGKKILPIMVIDKSAINESLDIIKIMDTAGLLDVENRMSSIKFDPLNTLLSKLGESVHSLAMPYWIFTPEFNDKSREYFRLKKEVKRGPFKDLIAQREKFIIDLEENLQSLTKDLKPYYLAEEFSLYDILIASHLWGLYVVHEYQFPLKIHQYLQNIKNICHFDYHHDYWS